MKKYLLVALFVTVCGFIANAQGTQFGLKAGLNATNLTGSASLNLKARADVNAGVFLHIPLSAKYSLQPELFYSGQGASLLGSAPKTTINLGYVSLPFLFKYTSPGGFFVESGPQASLLIYANTKTGDVKKIIFPEVRKVDFSWAAGVGLHTKINLDLDVRYNLGLTKTYTNDAKIYSSVYQVGLMYRFKNAAK
jgi:hypothetical protein